MITRSKNKIIKTPSKSLTSSYCQRNNINEQQFLKAMAWYQSAILVLKKIQIIFQRTKIAVFLNRVLFLHATICY